MMMIQEKLKYHMTANPSKLNPKPSPTGRSRSRLGLRNWSFFLPEKIIPGSNFDRVMWFNYGSLINKVHKHFYRRTTLEERIYSRINLQYNYRISPACGTNILTIINYRDRERLSATRGLHVCTNREITSTSNLSSSVSNEHNDMHLVNFKQKLFV